MAPRPEHAAAARPLPTRQEYNSLSELMRDRFGIELRRGTEAMIASRLNRALDSAECASIGEYLARLRSPITDVEASALIGELTTNYTGFLREPEHFELLRQKVLSAATSDQRLRLWSAACSSGEEAYSMAMCALEEMGQRAHRAVTILATDISAAMLDRGRRGIYQARALESLPPAWKQRYFLQGAGKWAGWCRLKPELRRMVSFRALNLARELPARPLFHAIFCRNVMIYFDPPTRYRLFEQLSRRLAAGGLVVVGHAEYAGLPAKGLVAAGQGAWIAASAAPTVRGSLR